MRTAASSRAAATQTKADRSPGHGEHPCAGERSDARARSSARSPYWGHEEHDAGRTPPDQRHPPPRAAGARRQHGHHGRGGRTPLGHLQRGGGPGREVGQGAPAAGHPRRRPRGHLLLEQPGPSRGVSGHSLHGGGAAHPEHPAAGRAAGLRDQPRRGPHDHRRRLADPVAGRRQGRSQDGRDHHRRRGRRHLGAGRDALLRDASWQPRSRDSNGPSSTSARPPPCATRAAPPATPRASCTRTAPPGCTPWPSSRPLRSA